MNNSQVLSMKRSFLVAFVTLMIAALTLPLFMMTSRVSAQDNGEDDFAVASQQEEDNPTIADLEEQPDPPEEPTPPAPKGDTVAERKETEGLPATFSGRTKCVTEVSGKSLAAAKKYGDLRAKSRIAQLKKYNVQTDNQVKKIKKSYKTEAKKYKIDKNVRVQRVAHNKDIKNEIATAKATIKGKQTAVKSAQTSAAAAEQVCSMIYDVRVYTYLDAKIKQQFTVDKLYRYNALLQAQHTTLTNNFNAIDAANKPKAADAMAKLTNPATSRSQALDSAQAVLNGIRPQTINDIQAKDPKKKTPTIFKEAMKEPIKKATAASSTDVKTGSAAKKAVASASKAKTTTTNTTNPGTSTGRTTKKTMTKEQINGTCKNANEATLKGAKNTVLAELTSACNTGIKAGFDKKSTSEKFCSTGGGKWKEAKSAKKVAACKYGYKAGMALR